MTHRVDERRSHPRIARPLEVESFHEGDAARLVATNLSLGGVYCTSDRDVPEMTRLSIRLLLPSRSSGADSAEPLDVDAVVVRRQPVPDRPGAFELALLFSSLSATQRDRLARFLA